MKYYIIAGEASGDLHGSNLVKHLNKIDQEADFHGFGGDLMKEAGAHITLHYKEMAFMGVIEVLRNLKAINRNFEICRTDILDYKPDVLILIDYAGFNLRMAKFAKEHNIKVLFYISPKVWVWKKSRIKTIKKYVDKLYLILPFEEEFFKANGYDQVAYMGNPLIDAIDNHHQEKKRENFFEKNQLSDKPIIALLAGSRKQEIAKCLPKMIEVSKFYPDYQFVVAGAVALPPELYEQYLKGTGIKVAFDQTYDLLNHAQAAIVTSGTATLETALLGVPEVVIYQTSMATYIIGKPFVNITFISLVNLIMNKEVVKEIIQFNMVKRIKKEMDLILYDSSYRETMIHQFKILIDKMGKPGVSKRVAEDMFNFITTSELI